MKLCQKCEEAISKAVFDEYKTIQTSGWGFVTSPVPESVCEFWAHKNLNNLIHDIVQEAERINSEEEKYL